MPCSWVKLPSGGVAIVKHAAPRRKRCCSCGELGSLLCDWKIAAGKTCDRPVCSSCTFSPAKDKDLCPEHAKAWRAHPMNIDTGVCHDEIIEDLTRNGKD